LMKGAQVGGPLAVDTPIPTVDGWTTMGEVRAGDWLFDECGMPCRVQSVSPVMTDHDCFRVKFDDGEEVVCDGQHRWRVWEFTLHSGVEKTLTTREMFGRTSFDSGKRYRFAIDVCAPAELPE